MKTITILLHNFILTMNIGFIDLFVIYFILLQKLKPKLNSSLDSNLVVISASIDDTHIDINILLNTIIQDNLCYFCINYINKCDN